MSLTAIIALLPVLSSTAQMVKSPGPVNPNAALSELRRDIDAILSDRNFADASWGISVISCKTGLPLYGHEAGKNRQVASNLKLLTTATALRSLGPGYRFSTELYLTGSVDKQGSVNGDLVIKTGGDPTISPSFGIDPQTVLSSWASRLDSLGVRSIRNIIVDASAFDAVPYCPGWAWDDEPFGFNAQISAAAIYDNAVQVTVTPGESPGDDVLIDIVPPTTYVAVRVSAVTSRRDSTSTLDVLRERGSNVIDVVGNIAAGSDPFTIDITIEDPPAFFAALVREALETEGLTVRGRAYNAAFYPLPYSYASWRRVAVYRSPELRDVVAAVNKQSLNLGAEMLVKKLGSELLGIGSTGAGLEVVKSMLNEAGIEVEHVELYDGSGLSRLNMISPTDITRFLHWVHRTAISEDFTHSLAVAGRDGTLSNRLRGTIAEDNVVGKTGYLNGIRSVSGYLRTRDQELMAFSIIINNYSVPTSVVNTAQDLILMRLASFSRKM